MSLRLSPWLAALLLCACASKPPPPDWQANAYSALKSFSSAYLSGNSRLANFELDRARAAVASTGRADLVARTELTRCAIRVASLEFDDCASYAPLAQDAPPSEQAYAAYLTGRWTGINPALLPAHHRAIVIGGAAATSQGGSALPPGTLAAVEDPLARLVAAGALLQTGHLSPPDIAVAVDTASAQGWRRPLLAWLGIQRQRASDAGEPAAAARIQRRIDLVLQTGSKVQ
ncbi:MAG: hypothetical protein A3F78_12005 [Burkholderiales bacterium RIFCSPLOWO2_12_FULL_61_40]|nr:MAG: hypothetical protein A3F78_12005 [Burkholderiales bacterium RIFCSPLOWO2_12_FULL_61_40]